MKIQKADSRTIFIISGGGGQCPSLTVANKGNASFKDDYYGSIRMNKSFLQKLLVMPI